MTVTVYRALQAVGSIDLQNNNDTVILQLRLPNTGKFMLTGRVMVGNGAANPAIITARMTTLDGATDLDVVWVSVPAVNAGSIACIALIGYSDLSATDNSNIVDIRCKAESGFAQFGQLYAFPIDQLVPDPYH